MTGEGPALPRVLHAFGFSLRKLAIVRNFLAPIQVEALGRLGAIPPGGTFLLWGMSVQSTDIPPGHDVVRVEDGFLRSVGLGADLVPPLSLVFDTRGIYFDATICSDLEHILQTASFTDPELTRARRLRERVVATAMTKYNVGGAPWAYAGPPKRVVLVPGQVEGDASLAFGAPGLRSNLALLRAVREANPDMHVLYKPHPDVVAGLRSAGSDEALAKDYCDEWLVDTPMGALLPLVDEVHVLTSQTGFEALLRGKKVVCYGQPFYAGWGLTTDILPVARRSKKLTLDALVAGALIAYPKYWSVEQKRCTTPEQALDALESRRAAARAQHGSLGRKMLQRLVSSLWRPLVRRR